MGDSPSISNLIAEIVQVGHRDGNAYSAQLEDVLRELAQLGASEPAVRSTVDRAVATSFVARSEDGRKLLYELDT